jgi:hemerythrin-like metal-binding protein
MALWQSQYETGNFQIDDQHQTLFKLINNLADAISQNYSQQILKSLLDELIDDTAHHFKVEIEAV